jgi:RimJ/RimL family protein N-acetyltransferase
VLQSPPSAEPRGLRSAALSHVVPAALRLTRYRPQDAAIIASWPRTEHELLWLAPGTPFPLTAAKVVGWTNDDHHRVVLRDAAQRPVGYAELHALSPRGDQLWIGHLIIAPECRRRGLGQSFVAGLLERTFSEAKVCEVVLLVFPENRRAIACYERCGFIAQGEETRHFAEVGRTCHFLRMAVSSGRFRRIRDSGLLTGQTMADRTVPEVLVQ